MAVGRAGAPDDLALQECDLIALRLTAAFEQIKDRRVAGAAFALVTADAVTAAEGAKHIRKRWLRVKHLFADRGYDRLKLMGRADYLDFVIEII